MDFRLMSMHFDCFDVFLCCLSGVRHSLIFHSAHAAISYKACIFVMSMLLALMRSNIIS